MNSDTKKKDDRPLCDTCHKVAVISTVTYVNGLPVRECVGCMFERDGF